MPAETACRIFRFGAFEVNEADGELRRNRDRIKLHAQPFQVLILFLDRPSEMVSREEIRTRLWADGTFVDFDHSLNTAVNKLRQALSVPELPGIGPPHVPRTEAVTGCGRRSC